MEDLASYISIISSIEKLVLYKCALKQASTLICEHLLSSSRQNRLKSCILHSTSRSDGVSLHEPFPISCQSQYSLIYLQIDARDLTSLKNLLMFLPNLSTLGKIELLGHYFSENLIIVIDIHLGTNVQQSDQESFPSSFCPCRYLTKLIIRYSPLECPLI